mmetsp:Transcript_43107/g.99856  ORF Transcript_43107/g.99856 Transcript_43107/m.99856 type:complete len:202 (-) Transcript_43107:173-778(-)
MSHQPASSPIAKWKAGSTCWKIATTRTDTVCWSWRWCRSCPTRRSSSTTGKDTIARMQWATSARPSLRRCPCRAPATETLVCSGQGSTRARRPGRRRPYLRRHSRWSLHALPLRPRRPTSALRFFLQILPLFGAASASRNWPRGPLMRVLQRGGRPRGRRSRQRCPQCWRPSCLLRGMSSMCIWGVARACGSRTAAGSRRR